MCTHVHNTLVHYTYIQCRVHTSLHFNVYCVTLLHTVYAHTYVPQLIRCVCWYIYSITCIHTFGCYLHSACIYIHTVLYVRSLVVRSIWFMRGETDCHPFPLAQCGIADVPCARPPYVCIVLHDNIDRRDGQDCAIFLSVRTAQN